MQHVFTREELYELVWSRAVVKVAADLGVSDVALRKHCIKHGIPLPDAKYWASVRPASSCDASASAKRPR